MAEAKDPDNKPQVIPEAELVDDLLEHGRFSEQLIHYLEGTGRAKVVSLRGPWGRGKTDVLHRSYHYATKRKEAPDSPICGVVWVNPWQYGRADLLSPLLQALLANIPSERLRNEKAQIKKVLTKLIGAASGAVLKAAGHEAIGALAEKLLDGLIAARDASDFTDDPVAPLGIAFRELVERFLVDRQSTTKSQLLIFVDDLDRCLPERQIALLEAFHFLVNAGAPVTFVMAVDGQILAAAARAHYKTDCFDVHRYLDKIFDLNFELPLVSGDGLREFAGHVHRELMSAVKGRNHTLTQDIGPSLVAALSALPHFKNPRVIRRFVDKLTMYVRRKCELPEGPIDIVFFWLLFLQTWPEARLNIDAALERGAARPTGSADHQKAQAVMEMAKAATSEPYVLLRGENHVVIGDQKYALEQLIKAYVEVNKSLSAVGL